MKYLITLSFVLCLLLTGQNTISAQLVPAVSPRTAEAAISPFAQKNFVPFSFTMQFLGKGTAPSPNELETDFLEKNNLIVLAIPVHPNNLYYQIIVVGEVRDKYSEGRLFPLPCHCRETGKPGGGGPMDRRDDTEPSGGDGG